jgi:hypothetical protein
MEYGKPVKIPDGRYYLKVSDGGQRVFFQLNKLDAPSFDTKNVVLKLDPNQHFTVHKYQEEIINKAVESSEEWFSRVIPAETIKKAFQSALTSDSQFEVSLATVNGVVCTTFFGADRQPKDIQSEWKKVDVLIELCGVWFLKKSFGPIFKIVQVKENKPAPNRYPSEYLFKDDPEPEENPDDYLD